MTGLAALDRIPAWSMAVTTMLLVQLSNALSVTVIAHIGSAGAAWLQMCFGAIFLLIIVRPRLRSIRLGDVPTLLVLGAATGLMTTFFLTAIARIPLGTAVAIEFLGPLTVAALASTRRSAHAWPLLAFLGVILLAQPWHGGVDLIGVAFALLSGACWALYNVLTQRVGDRFTGISGLSLTIPIAAVITAAFGLPQVAGGTLTWPIVLLAAGIALITPVIALSLEMLALHRMTHAAFGTLLALEPAFGVLVGLLALSQRPTALQLLGIAIVVAAGAAAQRGGRRPRTANPQTEARTAKEVT